VKQNVIGFPKHKYKNLENQRGVVECNSKSFEVKGPFAAKCKFKTLKMKKVLTKPQLGTYI
jgi:hypothetical protein